MNKAGKGTNLVVILVVAALAYGLIFGVPDFGGEKDVDPTPVTGSTAGCAVEDISFSPKMNQMGKLGTVVTGTNYLIVTDNIGAVASGTATTVATNKDLKVYFGENSTTHYTVVGELNTDCSDPLTYSVELAKADTSLRINLFTDTNQANAVAETQDIGSDDVVDMKICAKTSADEFYGNPACDHNVVIVEFDKTYIQDIEGDLGDADYTTQFFTATNTSNDGDVSLKFPLIGENTEECINLEITATSSNPTSSIAKPIIHFYDCDVDKNEDDLTEVIGVEDEDDNSIALSTQVKTIYLS